MYFVILCVFIALYLYCIITGMHGWCKSFYQALHVCKHLHVCTCNIADISVNK